MEINFYKLPKYPYIFLWSDFVEFYAMTQPMQSCSKTDFIGRICEETTEGHGYSRDEAHILWDHLIQHCKHRAQTLRKQYPFTVDDGLEQICMTFVKTHPQHRLYLGLLMCACRHHVPLEWHDEMTQDFAQVCHQLFIRLMPEGVQIQRLPAMVHQFPKHEQIAYIAKTARGKVLLCADDYNNEQSTLQADRLQKSGNLKSGIVDLLAWHPMGDERDAIPVALGRCDCDSERWFNAQQTFLNLETHLYTRHPCAKYHFSPIDLYSESQDWAFKEHLGRVILIDRYRIMKLTEEYFIYEDLPDWVKIDALCL